MNALARKAVLLDDPYNRPEDGDHMEFRLTYQGSLFSTQRDPLNSQRDNNADHKHDLRRKFHKQLKRLWEVTPFLHNEQGGSEIRTRRNLEIFGVGEPHDVRTLSAKHSLYGFSFVPLVTQDIELYCGLEILLRPDKPGGVIWAGDIDNRIKTLIDALRIPTANERYHQRTQVRDEQPFFVLLEDDKLVTKLSIETDQLLEFDATGSMHEVHLVITVRLRPFQMHIGNLEFGG